MLTFTQFVTEAREIEEGKFTSALSTMAQLGAEHLHNNRDNLIRKAAPKTHKIFKAVADTYLSPVKKGTPQRDALINRKFGKHAPIVHAIANHLFGK